MQGREVGLGSEDVIFELLGEVQGVLSTLYILHEPINNFLLFHILFQMSLEHFNEFPVPRVLHHALLDPVHHSLGQPRDIVLVHFEALTGQHAVHCQRVHVPEHLAVCEEVALGQHVHLDVLAGGQLLQHLEAAAHDEEHVLRFAVRGQHHLFRVVTLDLALHREVHDVRHVLLLEVRHLVQELDRLLDLTEPQPLQLRLVDAPAEPEHTRRLVDRHCLQPVRNPVRQLDVAEEIQTRQVHQLHPVLVLRDLVEHHLVQGHTPVNHYVKSVCRIALLIDGLFLLEQLELATA